MNRIGKILTGAATLALVTVSSAASAQYRYRDRDRGIDAGDVIAGVAVVGGIAAIASALNRDRGRYGYNDRYGYDGYNNGYRYRDNYIGAVNACARYADRYGGGVRILDVDRRGSNRFRVRGVIEDRFGGYGYNNRYGGYNRYNRYNGGNYGNRSFSCTATEYGRVTNFDLNGRNRW